MIKDPVCGKELDEETVRSIRGQTEHGANEVDPAMGTRRFHDGKWYYFDSVDCRFRFMANPSAYISKD
jgi:YHS domain-containing protein